MPNDLWTRNDRGEWEWEPSSPGQKRFVESCSPEILFSGHWGNGKTVATAIKALVWGTRWPGTPIALIRKVFNDLRTSTLRVWERTLPPDLWARGLVGGENAFRLDFGNGSFVDFMGLDRPQKLLSSDYGLILVDEANEVSRRAWEMAGGRLRSHACPARLIAGTTNPDGPTHWQARAFQPNLGSHLIRADEPCDVCRETGWLNGVLCRECGGTGKSNRVVREVIVAGLSDNDANLPRSYRRRRERLQGVMRRRFVLGQWVAHEGACFGESWDPDVHMIPNALFPESAAHPGRPAAWDAWNGFPPPDWPRIRGIDFGFVRPLACEWFAEDPDGRWFRYREIYRTGMRNDELRDRIVELEARERAALRTAPAMDDEETARAMLPYVEGGNVILTVTDHDPEAQVTLSLAGIACVNAIKNRREGVQIVERALLDRRLFLLRDVTDEPDDALEDLPRSLEEELPGIEYAPDVETKLEVGKREVPVKANDHGYDALWYALLMRSRMWKVTA